MTLFDTRCISSSIIFTSYTSVKKDLRSLKLSITLKKFASSVNPGCNSVGRVFGCNRCQLYRKVGRSTRPSQRFLPFSLVDTIMDPAAAVVIPLP